MTLIGKSWNIFQKTGKKLFFFSEILLSHVQKFNNKRSEGSKTCVGDNDLLMALW